MAATHRTIDVFIENPKGAIVKIHHDEVALTPTHCELVADPYAYAYGFVVGIPSGDGDMLDCFVISNTVLYTGDRLDCVPFACLEAWENDEVDPKLIAVPATEVDRIESLDRDQIFQVLESFMGKVFAGKVNRELRIGKFGSAQDAYALLDELTPS